MSAINFKDLKITTLTMIHILTGTISLSSAFHLLPITKMVLKQNRGTLTCKLPLCEKRGAILSMRHEKMIRGIIRSNDEYFFKNSITLDISTEIKNISLKISPNTIQLCGARSRENGIEAAEYVIAYLKDIKEKMDHLKSHMDEYQTALQWLEEVTKGEEKDKITYHEIHSENMILRVKKTLPDYLLVSALPEIPSHIDKTIAEFLFTLTPDMNYHSDYMNKIRNVGHFQNVYEGELSRSKTNEVMVNYNYNLGFRVNRDVLNQLIDGRNGLYSHYDNALVNSVTVELPYDTILDYTAKKVKKEIPHHTFLIYGSGAVTQSGPCSSSQPGKCSTIMEEAFNVFISTIMEIKEEIML